jgi:hypothetical protein
MPVVVVPRCTRRTRPLQSLDYVCWEGIFPYLEPIEPSRAMFRSPVHPLVPFYSNTVPPCQRRHCGRSARPLAVSIGVRQVGELGCEWKGVRSCDDEVGNRMADGEEPEGASERQHAWSRRRGRSEASGFIRGC